MPIYLFSSLASWPKTLAIVFVSLVLAGCGSGGGCTCPATSDGCSKSSSSSSGAETSADPSATSAEASAACECDGAASVPPAPTITQVEDDRYTPVVSVAQNTTTADTTPVVRGSLTQALSTGQVLHVYANRNGSSTAQPLGAATVDGLNWSYTPTFLSKGSYAFEAVVANQDDAAVLSEFSATYTIQVSVLSGTGTTSGQCYAAGSNTLVSCSSSGATELSGEGGQDGMGEDDDGTSTYTKIDDNGDEVPDSATKWCAVKDLRTGLIWENHTTSPKGMTNYGDGRANDASSYVASNAALCGFASGWRLPTVEELETLLNTGKSNPSMTTSSTTGSTTTAWFQNVASGAWYWTAMRTPNMAINVWAVNFMQGFIYPQSEDSQHRVRMVRTVNP